MKDNDQLKRNRFGSYIAGIGGSVAALSFVLTKDFNWPVRLVLSTFAALLATLVFTVLFRNRI
jgi:enamine deaminase RidA (YjgF/YER057c/UK114 family)